MLRLNRSDFNGVPCGTSGNGGIMETEQRINGLLHEAAEWRLISLLFECPVGEWYVNVKNLAKEVQDKKLRSAAKDAMDEACEGLYHSIFGPGGPCPPREVSYRSWVQPGYLISELSTFYKAFSYNPTTVEVADHIAVETGFIAYLKLKEAFAILAGAADEAEVTADAARSFTDQHLSKVAEKLTKTLAYSEMKYLVAAGEALFDRVGKDTDGDESRSLPVFPNVEDEDMNCAGDDGFDLLAA